MEQPADEESEVILIDDNSNEVDPTEVSIISPPIHLLIQSFILLFILFII